MNLVSRFAEPKDWPEIRRLHEEQNAKWGTNYELPYFWGKDRLIPVAIVAVDEEERVQQAFYVECTAELRFVGLNPRATAHLQRESKGLAYILRSQGFRWLECFVPRTRPHWWQWKMMWKWWKSGKPDLVKMIRKPLQRAGFHGTSEELEHFTLDMRTGAVSNEQGSRKTGV